MSQDAHTLKVIGLSVTVGNGDNLSSPLVGIDQLKNILKVYFLI